MGARVEQPSEFLPRASRTSHRHLEDMADSLHRLPSAAENLQVIIPRCNRPLLLQGEFCITLFASIRLDEPPHSSYLYLIRGTIFRRLGRFDEAKQALSHADWFLRLCVPRILSTALI